MANPPANGFHTFFEIAFGYNGSRLGGRNGDADLEPFLFGVPIDSAASALHDAFAFALAVDDGSILFLFEHGSRAILRELELPVFPAAERS